MDYVQTGTAQKEEAAAQRAIIDELQKLVLEVVAQAEATEGLQRGRIMGLKLGEAKHRPGADKAALRGAGG